MKDGRVYEHHSPINRGNPDNPISEDEVKVKFLKNAESVLRPEGVEKLFKKLGRLETLEDVSEFTELLS